MAIVKVEPIKIEEWNTASGAIAFTAINASAGAYYEHNMKDERCIVLIQNANSAKQTLTIKQGNGLQGVVDEVIEVPASSIVAIVLESGRFKNISGDNKGRVVMTGTSADLKVAVIKMP